MHGLAFDEADLVDRAGNLRVHVHDVVRHDRADAGHDDRHVGGL